MSCFESVSRKGSSRLWIFQWGHSPLRNKRASRLCDWIRFRLGKQLGLITRLPTCTTAASATFAFTYLTSSSEQADLCQEYVIASATQSKQLLFRLEFSSGFRLSNLNCWLWALSNLVLSMSDHLIWLSNSRNAVNQQNKSLVLEEKRWLLVSSLGIFLFIYSLRQVFFLVGQSSTGVGPWTAYLCVWTCSSRIHPFCHVWQLE